MWVIKIGGSWIKNAKVEELIRLINKFKTLENLIIVVGGGAFTDSVRSVYKERKMSEKTGHYIALKATEMFSHLLKEINNEITLISQISLLKQKSNKIKIWMPSKALKNEPSFIRTWESTSDSVAAWLHRRIRSKGLLFIKSLRLEKKRYKLTYLQRENILDKNAYTYLAGQKNIKVIGPDVIDMLKKSSNWSKLFPKFNEVELD